MLLQAYVFEESQTKLGGELEDFLWFQTPCVLKKTFLFSFHDLLHENLIFFDLVISEEISGD